MTTSVIVCGASGRLGRRVCALAENDDELELLGAIVSQRSASLGKRVTAESDVICAASDERVPSRADALIDFSTDAGTQTAISIARRRQIALVVATTGLSERTTRAISDISGSIPVLAAANFSLGAVVLAKLAAQAARALTGYDASIVEAHRAGKRDRPSGTAKRLAEYVRSAGGDLNDDQILSIRGGEIAGEHAVRFAGRTEQIQLTHQASSRDVFAAGTLRAAAWLKNQPPGEYAIEDVLGLSDT